MNLIEIPGGSRISVDIKRCMEAMPNTNIPMVLRYCREITNYIDLKITKNMFRSKYFVSNRIARQMYNGRAMEGKSFLCEVSSKIYYGLFWAQSFAYMVFYLFPSLSRLLNFMPLSSWKIWEKQLTVIRKFCYLLFDKQWLILSSEGFSFRFAFFE